MTATEAPQPGVASRGPAVGDAEAQPTGGAGETQRSSDRLVGRVALLLTLLPLVVSAVAVVAAVGSEYHPMSDHALTELQIRDVGRHEVLLGLYSRGDWNHPGPALFYVLAPFYWLTGGLSVGMSVGALAINGASVAGMGLIARRRGGTPMMLLTLLGCALLMRMLGADFLYDPWNCYVTALPFGLMIFLTWAMWGGDTWALPVGAAVATFLAQAHVGFVVLAAPLLVCGVVGLVAAIVLESDGAAHTAATRRGVRAGVVAAAVLVVGWLPPVIEEIRYAPGNIVSITRWFRHPEEPVHSLVDGWRVMSGQFGGAPEWLTVKRDYTGFGESPFIGDAPVPWLLGAVVVAAVVLWRRDVGGARSLLVALAVSFVVGMFAVARTVGAAFDYRLRWTYLPALVGVLIVAWAGWTVVADRWPRAGSRVLAPLALAGLVVVGGVNVVTAVTAGVPQDDDSVSMRSVSAQVLDNLPDTDGTVLVTDAFHSGAWHARGLVLELERQGVTVGVSDSLVHEYGRRRVVDPDEVGTVLVVTTSDTVDSVAARPGMRPIAEWSSLPESEMNDLLAERAQIQADLDAGRIESDEATDRVTEIAERLAGDSNSAAYRVAVFVDESFGATTPAAG